MNWKAPDVEVQANGWGAIFLIAYVVLTGLGGLANLIEHFFR